MKTIISDAMVEAAAIAAHEEFNRRMAESTAWVMRSWDELDGYEKEDARAEARACIGAVINSIRAEVLEEVARVCEEQKAVFLSDEYAAHQPLSSIVERFACEQCATAIRALKEKP